MLFKKKNPRYYVSLSREELILHRDGFLWFRNDVIRRGLPTEDVDFFLLKVMKAGKMI